MGFKTGALADEDNALTINRLVSISGGQLVDFLTR